MPPNNLKPPPCRLSPISGFTLIEKMVIVAILGIVASISAPGVWGMLNRAKLKQTVAEVRTALNETQREAIRGNKVCTVTLNFVDGKVTGSCLKTGDRNLAPEISIATNLISVPNPSDISSKNKRPFYVLSNHRTHWVSNAGSDTSLVTAFMSSEPLENRSKAAMVVKIISSCKIVAKVNSLENCAGHNTQKIKGEKYFIASSPSPSSSPRPSKSRALSYDIPIKYGVLGNPVFFIESDDISPIDPSGKIVFFFPDDVQGAKRCIAISNTLGLTRVGTYTGEMTPLAITKTGRCVAEKWDQQ